VSHVPVNPARLELTSNAAYSQIRTARALDGELRLTAGALRRGEISAQQVVVIRRAMEQVGKTCLDPSSVESELVFAARQKDSFELERHWYQMRTRPTRRQGRRPRRSGASGPGSRCARPGGATTGSRASWTPSRGPGSPTPASFGVVGTRRDLAPLAPRSQAIYERVTAAPRTNVMTSVRVSSSTSSPGDTRGNARRTDGFLALYRDGWA
jgi:hypothetical protein